ncbi:MAG: fimbrillin family protein [Bacteroidaceae bacterium]|nr:fimbrillin family protein [Bacteroidaceae bacterium]
MKNGIITISAILILAGCVGSEFDGNALGRYLEATIESGKTSTRAILIDNPGVRMQTVWQGGDCIGVFGDGVSNMKFGITEEDISEDGKSAKFSSGYDIPSGSLVSYSPYRTGTTISSNVISLDFPSTQVYYLKDGVAQPDPEANIMIGTGSAACGISFRNVMAILKIGQVFNEPTLLKSIEFRDISGKCVSGAMSVSWNGEGPLAEITGSGDIITLDCGEGLQFDSGQLGVFFIVVPARTYEKGFELTFVSEDGVKTVRTVGTALGKTLERSVVYTIGDISREYMAGATSRLMPTAQIMTPEKMDKVKITSSTSLFVYDGNGMRMEDCDGHYIIMPQFGMMVHKDLNPVEGGWMVFDGGTDDLPDGGVYRITSCVKSNEEYYDVVACPEINPAAAFESIVAGEPMVDASGNIDEEKGLPVDINGYIKSIVDESGNELYIHMNSAGELAFSAAELQSMVDVATKAAKPHSRTYKSPRLSGNLKSDNAELSVGASMTFNTRLALGVMQGNLQYACLSVNPQITVSESLTIKSEVELKKSFRLFTLTTHPIPVTPAVAVVVEIVFNASLGVGGNLQITASAESTTDLGTYSISYNDGDGVAFRRKEVAREVPGSFNMDLSGFEGSVYGSASIGARTSVSVWGLMGLGVSTDYNLKCGFFYGDGTKFALQPEIEFTPVFSSYFWSHKFEDMTTKIELDPIWEKYVIPVTKTGYIITEYNWSDKQYDIPLENSSIATVNPSTGVKDIKYSIDIEGECYSDLKVVLLVFKGTDIRITPQDPSDADGSWLKAYKAAGIEHLYSSGYMCDRKLEGISDDPDQVLEVGTYKAGTEKGTFEGTVSGVFSQGQAYGVVPAISVGDYYRIIDTGSSAYYYNPLIFWWPNRSNGMPYQQ